MGDKATIIWCYHKLGKDPTVFTLQFKNGLTPLAYLFQRKDLQLIKWFADLMGNDEFCSLLSKGYYSAAHVLASTGQLSTLKYLYELYPHFLTQISGCKTNALSFALETGQLNVAEWIHQKAPELLDGKASDDENNLILAARSSKNAISWVLSKKLEKAKDQSAICIELNESLKVVVRLACISGDDATISNALAFDPSLFSEVSLILAVQSMSLEFVLKILKRNPLLRFEKNEVGETPLHALVGSKDVSEEVLEYILKNFPEQMDAKTRQGLTPFFLACQSGNLEAAKTILEKNPIACFQISENGDTPLVHVYRSKLLNKSKIASWLIEIDPGSLNHSGAGGLTALHLACFLGDLDSVKLIIEKEPDLFQVTNHKNEDPLIYCLQNNISDPAKIIEYFILQNEKNPTLFPLDFKLLLEQSILTGHLQCLKVILKKRPELINSQFAGGYNLLMMASWYCHLEIVKYIYNQKKELLDQKGLNEKDAFYLACETNNQPVVDFFLLERPELIHRKYAGSLQPFLVACDTGKFQLANRLYQASSTVLQYKDFDFDCPHHFLINALSEKEL